MEKEYIGLVEIITRGGVTAVIIIVAYFLGKVVLMLWNENKKLRQESDSRIDSVRSEYEKKYQDIYKNYESKLEKNGAETLSILEKVLIMMSDNEKTLTGSVSGSNDALSKAISSSKAEVITAIRDLERTIRDGQK